MLTEPMDILSQHPIRKTKLQKQAFRESVQSYLTQLDYQLHVEEGKLGVRNLVIGDPEKAKYLVTAHYDTPAAMPFPNFITPCNFLPYFVYQLLVIVLFFAIALVVGIVATAINDTFWFVWTVCYVSIIGLMLLMLLGPANRNNANDNTSGVVTVLEIARSLPENRRDQVCFVLFDLEEAGLLGSAAFRKAHKNATEKQIVLNLDCVGDGDEILFFPNKKLIKDHGKMTWLCQSVGHYGKKSIAVRNKGFRYYPSDQKNFPYGVGIAAFRKKKLLGHYCSRIHTKKDTILETTNVNILRAALTTLICQ